MRKFIPWMMIIVTFIVLFLDLVYDKSPASLFVWLIVIAAAIFVLALGVMSVIEANERLTDILDAIEEDDKVEKDPALVAALNKAFETGEPVQLLRGHDGRYAEIHDAVILDDDLADESTVLRLPDDLSKPMEPWTQPHPEDELAERQGDKEDDHNYNRGDDTGLANLHAAREYEGGLCACTFYSQPHYASQHK